MNDKHRNSRRHKNLGCLTPKQNLLDTASAMRCHDDQIAPQFFRGFDDGAGGMAIGNMYGVDLKSHFRSRRLDCGEYALCKFRLIRLVTL